MAGVVPKRSTSGRKQWTLHDGPRNSLKRLRSQLASDGCPESQVVLAKQLLYEHCEPDVDQRENARLGVYWLIKASEQGNTEATALLEKCLLTGRGITEHNYLDVKSCITMTQDEKLARKAARDMFVSLSNGEDYITSEQLQRHMRSIDRAEKPPKTTTDDQDQLGNGELVNNYDEIPNSDSSEEETDWTNRPDHNNEKLTEDHLVAAAVNYSHGHLPTVNQILCLNEPDLNLLDHIPMLQRPILHPLLALKILYYRVIKFLGGVELRTLLPSDAQFLVLLVAYVFFSVDSVLLLLPMVVYYVSFVVMVVATFRMLQARRDYEDFRVWSGLFITYSGGGLNAQEAEFQFVRNNLAPYGHYFLALLLNLMVYPVIAEQWIPQSELTVVAFALTFMTLLGFLPKKRADTLVLFSFAVNVIAKYPYETDPVVTQGWRFLDLKVPTFAGYVIGNGVEFCINFRLLFYVFIPLLLLQMALRDNWRGTYKLLIPHCVTLSWLQIVIISSQGATMFGLLRATLALVGIVLFLPLVGLTSVILPAAALTKWLATNFTYTLLWFLAFLLLGLLICWLVARGRYRRYASFVQITFAIAAFFVVFNLDFKINKSDANADSQPLSWEVYQKFCHQPSWEQNSIAATQLKCIDLDDVRVSWEGYVNNVKIRSVTNKIKEIIDKLPQTLNQHFSCVYGDEINDDCTDDCLTFYETMKTKRKCTLTRYNTYTFEINLRMQSGMWGKTAEAILILEDYFKNFTFALQPSDHVWFKGHLLNENTAEGLLGGLRPHVVVDEIGCLDCHNAQLTHAQRSVRQEVRLEDVASFLFVGVKCVLNFLFNPIVIFK